MTLSGDLWSRHADLADAARRTPFVQGLADGTLPLARFQAYVAQDAAFLEAFARAYALAAARSPDRDSLEAFAGLLGGVREELRLHAGYAARWGVDLSGVEPAPATTAYTDFLLATAALGGVGLVCAAMTPCMRLYAHLGQTLPEVEPYGEWVRTYADPGFEQLAASLEALLDRHGTDDAATARAYRRAMELEVGFFRASA